jgi:hypothetical protein
MGRGIGWWCLVLAASLISPALCADKEVFSGKIVSTDRNRYRMRVQTQDGRRVVWLSVQNVWNGHKFIGRKVLKPGVRVLVTAERHKKEWRASRVEII